MDVVRDTYLQDPRAVIMHSKRERRWPRYLWKGECCDGRFEYHPGNIYLEICISSLSITLLLATNPQYGDCTIYNFMRMNIYEL
jgi:hypothetical protein